jgi:hypothetical protein
MRDERRCDRLRIEGTDASLGAMAAIGRKQTGRAHPQRKPVALIPEMQSVGRRVRRPTRLNYRTCIFTSLDGGR